MGIRGAPFGEWDREQLVNNTLMGRV
jgi:hypothetical protein